MSAPARRARSVAELKASMDGFMTETGRARGLARRARARDVIISTYPMCGTTWLQQTVHGLRTGGSMDFDEITQVVPWLELAQDMGVDPDAEQVAVPRVFKSHLAFDDVPRGARYLNAIRDPGDVLLSLYRFFDGWRMERGAISLDDFALEFFLRREGGRGYWQHVLSWWQARCRDDVLLLCYEDMREDLAGAAARIAVFIGIDADPALLDRVTRQSSLEFMKRHERQFDDHLVRDARDAACGLPPGGHTTKVARGEAGAARTELSPRVHGALDEAWASRITPLTGLADYSAMRAALAT
jgi:hypothetical protein